MTTIRSDASGAPMWLSPADCDLTDFRAVDRDPPVDGLAPPSQADIVRAALDGTWSPGTLREALRAHARRRAIS